mgnify:CR=1 FL=1
MFYLYEPLKSFSFLVTDVYGSDISSNLKKYSLLFTFTSRVFSFFSFVRKRMCVLVRSRKFSFKVFNTLSTFFRFLRMQIGLKWFMRLFSNFFAKISNWNLSFFLINRIKTYSIGNMRHLRFTSSQFYLDSFILGLFTIRKNYNLW